MPITVTREIPFNVALKIEGSLPDMQELYDALIAKKRTKRQAILVRGLASDIDKACGGIASERQDAAPQ